MSVRVDPESLSRTTAAVFGALGFSPGAAATIAESLVDADLRGVHSHGVMLVPLYAERLRRGVLTTNEQARTVADSGATAVLDGGNAAGQLVARQGMALAVAKAAEHGIGAVGVRHSNHFGAAGAYAIQAADAGCLGIATSNTTPLMPAPGGAERVVGNNPIALAAPSAGAPPLVLDIALSAVAGGKLRYAAHAGQRIPDTWATDPDGRPTTDPAEGVRGMLLPLGAHKGFGLALFVDILCGVLIGGAWGSGVRSLYREMSAPNDCGHFFLALDIEAFGDRAAYDGAIGALTAAVRGAARAPGVERLYVPGEIEWEAADAARRDGVELEEGVLAELEELAAQMGAASHVDRLPR